MSRTVVSPVLDNPIRNVAQLLGASSPSSRFTANRGGAVSNLDHRLDGQQVGIVLQPDCVALPVAVGEVAAV